MTPNFLKQLLHALGRMDKITFWSTPESEWLRHFLLKKDIQEICVQKNIQKSYNRN